MSFDSSAIMKNPFVLLYLKVFAACANLLKNVQHSRKYFSPQTTSEIQKFPLLYPYIRSGEAGSCFYFPNSMEFAIIAPIMQTNVMNKGQIVEKPWGYEIIWAHTERYVGKILHINKGESLSYQYHVVKDETIRLLSGALEMDIETSGERGKLRLVRFDDPSGDVTNASSVARSVSRCWAASSWASSSPC